MIAHLDRVCLEWPEEGVAVGWRGRWHPIFTAVGASDLTNATLEGQADDRESYVWRKEVRGE